MIGGILDACGFPGFLADHDKAIRSLDPETDSLHALYEEMLRNNEANVQTVDDETRYVPMSAMGAREWLPIVKKCGIAGNEWSSLKSEHGKQTRLGRWFSNHLINKPISVEWDHRNATATLVRESRLIARSLER